MGDDETEVPQVDQRFEFEPLGEEIDWKNLASASHPEISAQHERFARMIALGRLERTEGDVNAPPAMIKAFQLLQLSAQYASHCDQILRQRMTEMQRQRERMKVEVSASRSENDRRRREVRALRRELKRLDTLSDAYGLMHKTSALSPARDAPHVAPEPLQRLDTGAQAAAGSGPRDHVHAQGGAVGAGTDNQRAEAVQLEAEKARHETEEARCEIEEKVRRENEEKARREIEEKVRRENEEKVRREIEEKVRRENEEEARRENEEKVRRENEEKVRRENEEKARRDAEEKRARCDAEEKARRKMQEKAQCEAEKEVRREAENTQHEAGERQPTFAEAEQIAKAAIAYMRDKACGKRGLVSQEERANTFDDAVEKAEAACAYMRTEVGQGAIPPAERAQLAPGEHVSRELQESAADIRAMSRLRELCRRAMRQGSSLEAIFRYFDGDGDGFIDRVEMKRGLAELGLNMSRTDVRRIMRMIAQHAGSSSGVEAREAKMRSLCRPLESELRLAPHEGSPAASRTTGRSSSTSPSTPIVPGNTTQISQAKACSILSSARVDPLQRASWPEFEAAVMRSPAHEVSANPTLKGAAGGDGDPSGESGSESEDVVEQPLTFPPPPMPTEEAVAAEMRALAAATTATAVPQHQHVNDTSAPATPAQSAADNTSVADDGVPVHTGNAGAVAGTPSGPDNSLLLSPPSPPPSAAAKAAVSENLFSP
eukprot:g2183.t1